MIKSLGDNSLFGDICRTNLLAGLTIKAELSNALWWSAFHGNVEFFEDDNGQFGYIAWSNSHSQSVSYYNRKLTLPTYTYEFNEGDNCFVYFACFPNGANEFQSKLKKYFSEKDKLFIAQHSLAKKYLL